MGKNLTIAQKETGKPLAKFLVFYLALSGINLALYAILQFAAQVNAFASVASSFLLTSILGSIVLFYTLYKSAKKSFTPIFLFCLGWLGCGGGTLFLYNLFPTFFVGGRGLLFYILLLVIFVPVNLVWQFAYMQWPEIIRYLVGGFLVFVISFSCYFWLTRSLQTQEMLANIISWIVSNVCGFFINKMWVFQKKASNFKDLVMELVNFFSGRLLTSLILDFGLFALLFYVFGMNDILIKVICTVLIVIANYFWSILLTFSKKKGE